MSLVDYASSSDDDVSEEQEQKNQQQAQQEEKPHLHLPKNPPQHKSSPSSILLSDQTSGLVPTKSVAQPLPSLQIEKLPDASVLLNSPAISLGSGSTLDHASQVSAAMAENAAQRKRDLNGGPSSSYLLPRGKVPRGTLPHSKNVPDTGSGMLVPPQLRGRHFINLCCCKILTPLVWLCDHGYEYGGEEKVNAPSYFPIGILTLQ